MQFFKDTIDVFNILNKTFVHNNNQSKTKNIISDPITLIM